MIDMASIRVCRILLVFMVQFIIGSTVSHSTGKQNCSSDGIISGMNINNFEGCVQINGSVQITPASFDDMHPNSLEIFKTVTTITGFLSIEGYHTDFKNLSFFRNLELLHGYTSDSMSYTLHIDNTSLRSLDLMSLKQVKGIGVSIIFNKALCYANTINWHNIIHGNGNAVVKANRKVKECEEDGFVCDPQCSENGCWNAGPDKCFSCKNYQQGNDCVEKCDDTKRSENSCRKACPINMYEDNGVCKHCHAQCVGCNGISANQCTLCRNYKDEESCVQVCPESKYPMLGECHCIEDCTFDCIVTENDVSCNRCAKASDKYDHIFCKNTCPTGYFQSSNVNNGNVNCSLCHSECVECFEPGNSGCLSCKHKTLIYNDIPYFICTSDPNEFSNCIQEPTDASTYMCSHMEKEIPHILLIIIPIVIVLLLVIGLEVWFLMKKWERRRHFTTNNPLLGYSENSRDKSDPIISRRFGRKYDDTLNSKEIGQYAYKGNEKYIINEISLNQGSFGNWFHGINDEKCNIIIKMIEKDLFEDKDNNPLSNKILTISNLEHPYLLDVKVCLSENNIVKIIAKYMPLGNVQDYIQRHLYHIEPLLLLNWCKQIADGMFYLESKKIVHGNLCAKNILLCQTADYSIKISNYYQSYLLGNNYKKSKIFGCCKKSRTLKWDCIQGHNFNHKSDAWAFGLTMYELLSFGKDPWEHITINNDRNMKTDFKWAINTPCPKLCRDKMYEILRKCWLREPQDRPDFRELSEYFKNTLYNPDIYINQSIRPSKRS